MFMTNQSKGRANRWVGVLIAFLILTAPYLSAQHFIHYPVDEVQLPRRCDSEVFGEALFWAPSPTEFHYANVGSIEPTTLFERNAVRENFIGQVLDPGYDWGFRVGYRMNRSSWFFRTEFLWIQMESEAFTERPPGDNILTLPSLPFEADQAIGFQTAFANSDTQYQNTLFQVGMVGTHICRGFYETFVGAETIYYRSRVRVRAQGEVTFPGGPAEPLPIRAIYSQQAEMVGMGLGAGLRGLAYLGCGFSMGGFVEANATVSRIRVLFNPSSLTQAANFAGTPPPNFYQDIRSPRLENLHPCFSLSFKGRVNVQYSRCIGCHRFDGQVGFEIHSYKIGLIGGPLISFSIHF